TPCNDHSPLPASDYLSAILDEAVAHLAEALDLRLHHIAGLEEAVPALADAAAGAADEHIAGLERNDVRGVFDLLFRRVDELRGIAVLLHIAVHGEADEELHVIFDEGCRREERPGRREIVMALAAEPIGAQRWPVGPDLDVAARDVVRRHEAGDMLERLL